MKRSLDECFTPPQCIAVYLKANMLIIAILVFSADLAKTLQGFSEEIINNVDRDTPSVFWKYPLWIRGQ